MSGDLQAKRRQKSRLKKKMDLQDLEKKEYLEESQLIFAEDSPSAVENKKARKGKNKHGRNEQVNFDADGSDDDQYDPSHGKSRVARKLVYLLLVAGLIAGLAKGAYHYKDLIGNYSIKNLGANIILPDFQGLQQQLNLESMKAACKDLGDSADRLVIQPLIQQFLIFEEAVNEYLAKYITKTGNGHPTDDSEDYPPELNAWIQSTTYDSRAEIENPEAKTSDIPHHLPTIKQPDVEDVKLEPSKPLQPVVDLKVELQPTPEQSPVQKEEVDEPKAIKATAYTLG